MGSHWSLFVCVCVSKSVPKTHNYIASWYSLRCYMFIQRRCIAWICAKLLFSAPIQDAGEHFNGMWSGWRDISIALANFKKKQPIQATPYIVAISGKLPSWLNPGNFHRRIATTTQRCLWILHSALSLWVWDPDLWIFLFPLKVQQSHHVKFASDCQWLIRDPYNPPQPTTD